MSFFEELTGLGVERKVGRKKITDDPQHPGCCHRGKHRGARTPEEQYVHQTGLPTRLPRELTVVLERWVLATRRMGGEVGSI